MADDPSSNSLEVFDGVISSGCPVSAGCYFLFGHLLPPSEAEVRRLIERQPILRQW